MTRQVYLFSVTAIPPNTPHVHSNVIFRKDEFVYVHIMGTHMHVSYRATRS
jgi:hypothetical protein